MGVIKTYKEGEFSQVNLDNGDKVLISCGSDDTRVFQLGFLNIPKKTIHIFSSLAGAYLVSKIDHEGDSILWIANKFINCKDVGEVKEKCEQLEKELTIK